MVRLTLIFLVPVNWVASDRRGNGRATSGAGRKIWARKRKNPRPYADRPFFSYRLGHLDRFRKHRTVRVEVRADANSLLARGKRRREMALRSVPRFKMSPERGHQQTSAARAMSQLVGTRPYSTAQTARKRSLFDVSVGCRGFVESSGNPKPEEKR